MTTYGLTLNGFNAKSQSQIIKEIQDSIKGVFGNNVNFAPSSNFGQIVGIFSEREALLWQILEAVYASQYPSGAEGISVDNILALNNMKRLKATHTKTDPTSVLQSNGITLFGLLVKGTPGTLVEAGSIVTTNDTVPVQFKIDSDITIQAAVNAIQNIFLSNLPTSGRFSLLMPNEVVTAYSYYNSIPQKARIFFSAVPTYGNFSISLTRAGSVVTTASLPFGATLLQIQSAIQALDGYSGVTVTGSYSSGFVVDFSSVCNPVVTMATNTTDATISVVDSIQSTINNVVLDSLYPYTDATVIAGAQGYAITFGNGYLISGQISCSSMPLALMIVSENTLQNSSSVTNIKIVNTASGSNAQGSGSATCINTGPNFVAAGSLNTIGTPISGWASVINDLDCITGENSEDDTDALLRRSENLQANANGPLAAIVSKVRAVENVLTAIGEENVYSSSRQKISFSSVPIAGSFKISLDGYLTPSIPYNATSSTVQAAIRSVSGYETVVVKGDVERGFTINFDGSLGGKYLPLVVIENNSTGASISASYTLPGKSFEIIVQDGDDNAIAKAILASKPGGMLAYGTTVVQVEDDYKNIYSIGFSRPTPVPIYVAIVLETDLLTSETPEFDVASIATIESDIVNIGNAVGIGGLIIGFGSKGLIGAFNSVPGILNYTLYFGRTPNPTTNTNIQMQNNEVPTFESFLVSISYT